MLVTFDRSDDVKFNFYDMQMNLLPFTQRRENYNKPYVIPKQINEMIRLAEKLAKPFIHVRVDFYLINEQIKIGELTFNDGAGLESFQPVEWDYKLGELMKLPYETLKNILIDKEQSFGGLIDGVHRVVSPLDPRTKEQLLLYGGMRGGDRMHMHGYASKYAQYLKPFIDKNKPVILAEVGILMGTGLAIWCDIFPTSRILGFDINLDNIKNNMPNLIEMGAFKNNKPELYEFNQFKNNKEFLLDILKRNKIDICIDDGVHSRETILRTFSDMLPFLADDFVYFIEDYSTIAEDISFLFPNLAVDSCGELTVVTREISKITEDYITQKQSVNKKVIYTCMVGDFDNLVPPTVIDSEYDYIFFTDNKFLLNAKKIGVWDIRPLQYTDLNKRLNNRWHKFFPHIILPEYEVSIYIDSNVYFKTDAIYSYIDLVDDDVFISIPKHYKRDCIYQEAKKVMEISLDAISRVQHLIDYYKSLGFPEKFGLAENNIIYRKHNNTTCIKLMEEWWELLIHNSSRDQLCLFFLIWKNKINFKYLTENPIRTDKINFALAGRVKDMRFLNEWSSNSDVIKLLLVDNITEENGQLDAVKAVKILNDKGCTLELIMLGNVDSTYVKKLDVFILENKLNNILVNYTLEVNDQLLMYSDIILSCSKTTPNIKILIDAMRSKKPIILCADGLFCDANFALKYEASNPLSLATKVEQILEKADVTYNRIQEAYDFVSKNFVDKIVTDDIRIFLAKSGMEFDDYSSLLVSNNYDNLFKLYLDDQNDYSNIRIDLSEKPNIFILEKITIIDTDQNTVFDWHGDISEFYYTRGIHFSTSDNKVIVYCIDNDPQIILPEFPHDIRLSQIIVKVWYADPLTIANHFFNMDKIVAEQKHLITDKEDIIRDKNKSIGYFINELNLIYSTKGYRLLQSLRRALRVLLPANSIRRKVVKYFIYKPLEWIYKLIATIYNTIMKLFKCCFSPLFILQYKISSYYRRYGFLKLIKKCFTYPFDKIFSQRHKMRELYERYAKIVNLPDFNEIERQSNVIFDKKIKFSIITPLYNTDEQMLKDMLNSVINQTYNNWELCLVDGSDDKHHSVKNIVMKYADADDRIRYNKLPKNLGISGNSNKALEMSTGDYIALLDHDDVLHPSALFMVMEKIEDGADFIYSDEAKFTLKIADVYSPYFKPDFSVYNLRANNYICHFTIFSRKLYELVGGFREEFNGSQDHDLVLRLTEIADKIVHIPMILYFWRNHPGSVASSLSAKQYAVQAGVDAVQAHLDRIGLKAKVESINNLSVYRVRYEISGNPKISIIIPNKDLIDDLKKCINSILKYTTYNNYEIIIVENNSVTNEIFDYYKEVEKLPNIKVIFYNGEFNYSKINNFAVKYATGDYFLFLNNDIEIMTKEWIEEMLMLAQYNDVGVVGIKLYYPDNSIQHGGVILGLGGIAGHSHCRCPMSDYGYFARLIYVQEYSAVTAACMMVKKDIFIKVNGFEEALAVAFNDVDLCLKIREAGYKIIWTPFSEAYHHESKSRGYDEMGEDKKRFMKENEFMFKKWEVLIKNDPFYNQNLSLTDNFQIK